MNKLHELVMSMFCKEVRCVWCSLSMPLVETRGYKMLDVVPARCSDTKYLKYNSRSTQRFANGEL